MKFGLDKSDTLPDFCRNCDRMPRRLSEETIIQAAAGESGLNHSCATSSVEAGLRLSCHSTGRRKRRNAPEYRRNMHAGTQERIPNEGVLGLSF